MGPDPIWFWLGTILFATLSTNKTPNRISGYEFLGDEICNKWTLWDLFIKDKGVLGLVLFHLIGKTRGGETQNFPIELVNMGFLAKKFLVVSMTVRFLSVG